jgi:hypothetical protein
LRFSLAYLNRTFQTSPAPDDACQIFLLKSVSILTIFSIKGRDNQICSPSCQGGVADFPDMRAGNWLANFIIHPPDPLLSVSAGCQAAEARLPAGAEGDSNYALVPVFESVNESHKNKGFNTKLFFEDAKNAPACHLVLVLNKGGLMPVFS